MTVECKIRRTGMIMGALIAGSLVTMTGCGRPNPAASTDASRNPSTVSPTSPADQAKLQAAIQKAQAQGAARQALAAAHPHVPAHPPGN